MSRYPIDADSTKKIDLYLSSPWYHALKYFVENILSFSINSIESSVFQILFALIAVPFR